MNKIIILLIAISFFTIQARSQEVEKTTPLPSIDLKLDLSGDYLIKAQKQQNMALVSQIVGTLIASLGATMDADEGMPLLLMGGAGFVVGSALNISAIQQIGKAGRALKRKKANPIISHHAK